MSDFGGRMIDELLLQYETQGYLHLHNVIAGPTLSRLQTAFETAYGKCSERQSSKEQFFDIPHILDQDDVFVDLADLPTLFPVLLAIIGPGIQLLQTQARILRPGPSHTPPWHTDMAGLRGVNIGQTLNFHLKVHFYPFDLSADQGCLAFIPGSHRYPDGAERPTIPEDSDSPVIVKCVPRAGDVVLFNTHVLHMALSNRSQAIRKTLIYSYSHFWVKGTVSGVPRDLDRLATTPPRRQLFGQPATHTDPPFFAKAYEAEHTKDLKGIVLAAGQRLLGRTLGGYTSKR